MTRNKRPASSMRRVHRTLGVFAAIFVIFMVLSGLTINHSNGLGLDQRHVTQRFLLGWYGLGEPDNMYSYAVGDDWLTFADSQLYLNDKSVETLSGGVGAVSSSQLFIAAGNDELLLLDFDGNLVERLSWFPVGNAPIESIGLNENAVVTVKSAGNLWLADAEFLNWRQVEETATIPHWSISKPAPEALQQAVKKHYRGAGLSLERVLLDLHSGRIFGPIGILVYDLLALVLGFLAISGFVLWVRSRRNGKSK